MQSLLTPTLFKPNISESPSYEDTISNRKNARICQIAKWCFALLGTGLALTHAFSYGDRRIFVAKHLATQLSVIAFSLASFCTALFFQILGSKHNNNLTEEKVANARVQHLYNEIEPQDLGENFVDLLNAKEVLVEERGFVESHSELKLLFPVKQVDENKIVNLITLAFRRNIIFRFNTEICQNFDFNRDVKPLIDIQIKLLKHISKYIYTGEKIQTLSEKDVFLWNKILNNFFPESFNYNLKINKSGEIIHYGIPETIDIDNYTSNNLNKFFPNG
ncbi:MAG: hypothetical protein Tsb0021_08070 [Chlamydiales bacterium]